jgi:Ca2+-dependent lipid-binding protein
LVVRLYKDLNVMNKNHYNQINLLFSLGYQSWVTVHCGAVAIAILFIAGTVATVWRPFEIRQVRSCFRHVTGTTQKAEVRSEKKEEEKAAL